MLVIVIYDIGIERIDSVRHILKQYITWIQNSAFEGEITEGSLEEVRLKINQIIDKSVDSVIIYKINNPKWLKKTVWGVEKNSMDTIV
jgi:CRISPR-associated protein Cas2